MRERCPIMTTTSASREEFDPKGKTAPFPGESRADACARWAEEDELEEDVEAASRAAFEIGALRDEEIFVTQLSQRSLQTLPAAVRRLYRQNPSNPGIRKLHDSLVGELYERMDDELRGALPRAVGRMLDVMENGEKDADRLRAAVYVFERLRGKTPEVIEHRQDKPFQAMLTRLTTGPRPGAVVHGDGLNGLPAGEEPIEAEIVAESLTAPPDRIRELTTRHLDTGKYGEEAELARTFERTRARRKT